MTGDLDIVSGVRDTLREHFIITVASGLTLVLFTDTSELCMLHCTPMRGALKSRKLWDNEL